MLMPLLLLLATTQVPTSGPPMRPEPRPAAVQRTGDATVLGAIGAADANVIEVSTLASAKASAGAVKALATTLRKDHERSLTAGTAIAKQYRITRLLPNDSAMARRQVRVMLELNTLSGAPFDRAFVEWVVTNHRALLTMDEQLLRSERTRASVKRFLRDQLPTLRRHLATAEAWLVANPSAGRGATWIFGRADMAIASMPGPDGARDADLSFTDLPGALRGMVDVPAAASAGVSGDFIELVRTKCS